MRSFLIAVATAAVFAFPVSASAAPAGSSAPATIDLSSQGITIDTGGPRVRVGHDRYDSRRRERMRDRDRYRDRGVRRGCRQVTIREPLRGGGVRIIKRERCG